MRRPSLLHLALGFALALASSSCLSPTLPLPPPEPESILETRTGVWIVSGSCHKGATITVTNTSKHRGVVVEDFTEAGNYAIEIEADLCDTGSVSEKLHGEISDETPFVFDKPNGMSSSSCH